MSENAGLELCARRAFACLLLALAALLIAVRARTEPSVPPKPHAFVTDRAGVLGDAVLRSLESDLRAFEAATSNHVLVYIEPDVPDGTDPEELAAAAVEAWGAGQDERQNGVVLFVFPRARAARIEVGRGLGEALPEALASRIVRDEMVPRFSKGEWNAGVLAGVKAVKAATKGEYRREGRRRRGLRIVGIPPEGFILLAFFVLPLLFGRRRRGFWWLSGRGFGGGAFGGWSGDGGSSFGGGGASGRW